MNIRYDKLKREMINQNLWNSFLMLLSFKFVFLSIIFPFSWYRPYPSVHFLSTFCLTHCSVSSMSMKFRSIKWLPVTYSIHVVSEGLLSIHFHRLFFRFSFFNLLFNLLYCISQVASQPWNIAANESPYCTRKAHIEVCMLAFFTN